MDALATWSARHGLSTQDAVQIGLVAFIDALEPDDPVAREGVRQLPPASRDPERQHDRGVRPLAVPQRGDARECAFLSGDMTSKPSFLSLAVALKAVQEGAEGAIDDTNAGWAAEAGLHLERRPCPLAVVGIEPSNQDSANEAGQGSSGAGPDSGSLSDRVTSSIGKLLRDELLKGIVQTAVLALGGLLLIAYHDCQTSHVTVDALDPVTDVDAPERTVSALNQELAELWLSRFASDTLERSVDGPCRTRLRSTRPGVSCLRQVRAALETIALAERDETSRAEDLRAAIDRLPLDSEQYIDTTKGPLAGRRLLFDSFDGLVAHHQTPTPDEAKARLDEYEELLDRTTSLAGAAGDMVDYLLGLEQRTAFAVRVTNASSESLVGLGLLLDAQSKTPTTPTACPGDEAPVLSVPPQTAKTVCFPVQGDVAGSAGSCGKHTGLIAVSLSYLPVREVIHEVTQSNTEKRHLCLPAHWQRAPSDGANSRP